MYTEIVTDMKAHTLQGIIRGRADTESVIHTDGWRGYDGLADVGFEKHFRVNHGNNEFSKGYGTHINGIESFWGYAKHRLVKFKDIPCSKFVFRLKETEFRFNHRGHDLYKILPGIFRNFPLYSGEDPFLYFWVFHNNNRQIKAKNRHKKLFAKGLT